MGFLEDAAAASKPREFDVSTATTEELYAKMEANAAAFEIPFSLKSGLGGKKIVFDTVKELEASFTLTVKNGRAKLSPVVKQTTTTVGMGGFSMRVDKSGDEIASVPQKRAACMDRLVEAVKKAAG